MPYNEIVYNNGIYGNLSISSDVRDIKFMRSNLIEITFNKTLVVNDSYYDFSQFVITPVGDSPNISIRNILQLSSEIQSVTRVYLVTDSTTEGSSYDIAVPAFLVRDGTTTLPTEGTVMYFRTKIELELKSIPRHFDKSISSNISSLVTAIAMSDEYIGGSRKEMLGAPSVIPPINQ